MTKAIACGEYMGYRVEYNWSYSCPALKLFGYVNDRQLKSAIRRELTKRAKRAS